ncbi:hypothetical protein CRE_07765 [Caenorhabditis remanei]|uniref:BRCT domain-containing protein n=1 Tax=Caenorhabditis remanei TaxID=31234 RepID=E3N6S1_CAERE|nr:hypothetical protein CRE_07765 [Caenorhabditis remanei]
MFFVRGWTATDEIDYGDDFEYDYEYGYGYDDGDDYTGRMKFVAGTKKKIYSDLGLIYNKLSILTRITSAISLQSAAITKSVKIRDVIRELVKAPAKELDELIKINPTGLVPILETSFKASEELKVIEAEIKKLDEDEDFLKLMSLSIDYVKREEIDGDQVELFFNSIYSKEFDKVVLTCDDSLVDLMTDFSTIIAKNSQTSLIKKDMITRVGSSYLDIQKCLKQLEGYESKTAGLTSQLKIFDKLIEAKGGVILFNGLIHKTKTFEDTVDLVGTVFSKTKNFWKPARWIGGQMSRIIENLKTILDPAHQTELSLTLGFPNTGDLSRVSRDLKSNWFREKVAQRHSVNELGRELKGFFVFGKKIRKLRVSWNTLREKFKEVSGMVSKFSGLMKWVEESGLGENDLKIAQDTRDSYTKFWKDVPVISDAELTGFDGVLGSVSQLKEHFDGVKSFLEIFEKMRKELLGAEQYVKDIGPKYEKEHSGKMDQNPILKLENPLEMALSLGKGMKVLGDMVKAIRYKRRLRRAMNYSEGVTKKIIDFNEHAYVKEFWKSSRESIGKLLEELDALNNFAAKIHDESPMEMRKILDQAAKVHGFSNVFRMIAEQLSHDNTYPRETKNFEKLGELELDFSSHRGYLHAASLSFDELKNYFDEVFDLNHERHSHEVEPNHLPAIIICVAVFFLVIIAIFIAYGFTQNGRKMYVNIYLYYFGKPEVFEKRWRYSLFLDRQDGKNALIDAAREINATNVMIAVKKGAYINVFNKFGNTALHSATKRGHPEIVEILIRNGADCTLLNSQNKTPVQMIPVNYPKLFPDKVERYRRLERIYIKYQKKKFRQRVPNEFPATSYHIYIEERTEDKLTDKFTEKFQSITSDEATLTTTHLIVHTDKDGILETDNLELLVWVFSGVIVVKESWMSACLKDEKMIGNEWDFVVTKIRYKGIVYDTVPQWAKDAAKGVIPYLCGIYVAVVADEYPNLLALASIVTSHGGVMCEKFPEKETFNRGFRPYFHVHKGPLFLVHDGKRDLSVYKNDPDKMYTVLTEEEFVRFMLERKIQRNKSPNPIPPMNDMED